jgi:hypothetical protein
VLRARGMKAGSIIVRMNMPQQQCERDENRIITML